MSDKSHGTAADAGEPASEEEIQMALNDCTEAFFRGIGSATLSADAEKQLFDRYEEKFHKNLKSGMWKGLIRKQVMHASHHLGRFAADLASFDAKSEISPKHAERAAKLIEELCKLFADTLQFGKDPMRGFICAN